ncbi:MAG: LysM domain-containing protein, partial [Oscillospiraceae bacterium]
MTIHVVKKGDTIWNIAKQYNVSTGRIINDNAIADPKNLVIGQALIILIPKTVYTIRKGDTLASV